MGKSPVLPALAVLITASVLLSGCGGSKTSTSPSPSPSASSPTPSASPTPTSKPVSPGAATGPTSYSFQSSAPATQPKFTVATAWTKLKFTYWLNSTAACFVLTSEPPSGTSTGPPPSLLFTSPSGQKIEFKDNWAQSTCNANPNGGPIPGHQAVSKDGTNELGDWNVTIHGIGQNVKLTYLVAGS